MSDLRCTLSQQEFAALLVFLVVAAIIGSLASRMREHSLFEISRKLSGVVKLDDVALADFFGSHE
jgi:hypothetical protein